MYSNDRRSERPDNRRDSARSNLPLLLIATAFLCVTIGLVLMQSRLGETPVAEAQVQPAPQPVIAATTTATATAPATSTLNGPLAAALRAEAAQQPEPEELQYDVVSRAPMPLLAVNFTPIDRITSAVISEQLRQPIRLVNMGVPKRDLSQLTDDVMSLLSPARASVDPALKALLMEAINQRQSDAYIRELLNMAATRDGLEAPTTLRTTNGTLDAYSLLKAMAQTAGSPVPLAPENVETNGIQKIVPGDSLARLALRYYGQPLKYDIILTANPQIDPANPVLTPGDVIQMPKP